MNWTHDIWKEVECEYCGFVQDRGGSAFAKWMVEAHDEGCPRFDHNGEKHVYMERKWVTVGGCNTISMTSDSDITFG